MASPNERYITTPSVVDRLLGSGVDANNPYTLSQLREDIRRDIESFLNTRMQYLSLPKDLYPELSTSILTYGRPDLGTLRSERELRRFSLRIEEGIRRFEPRFQTVQVELVGTPTLTDRTLKLRIKSTLRMEPSRSFDLDSNVDMATGQCLLRIR